MEKNKTIEQITKWCSGTTYISKHGTRDLKQYNKGFEAGIAFVKETILSIIQENENK